MTHHTVAELNELGRVRLSPNFFMRDMLYSETSNVHGVPNIPEDVSLAIAVGQQLCRKILEPLRYAFGQISIRSAYRSPQLNAFCHERYKAGDEACWCTDNESNAARHIWDRMDATGYLGGTATVVIPGYLEHYERTGDYRPLAWWIRDNVPAYAEVTFFKPLCAFNVRWYEGPSDKTISYLDPPTREFMTKCGDRDFMMDQTHTYSGIIPGRALD